MKKILILLLFSISAFGQSYHIKGTLVDTTHTPLEFATMFLLNPSDSTMITFGRTDMDGKFEFKGVKKADVILQASYVGFIPLQKLVEYQPDNLNRDLGEIELMPIDETLMEVIVRAAKAPMVFKGDTVEYDAAKFKVPPGSTVEDLLRRLPGFQVNADGDIKAQGEQITKVMVDGKRFFGSDPKAATKNLPSEAVSKVQVYNDASEQAKLTGLDDGKKEKTLNLELKDDYKKGSFGKLSAGVGTDEKLLAKGNMNRFNEKSQFSIIGFGNNISVSGLSYNDYNDFMGSQAYNWGNNVDFGFDSGGFRIIYGSEDDGEGMSIPQSWGPGRGQSENYAGGINYNYDTKKNKISSNYFYNKTHQQLIQETFRDIFLPNTQYSINSQENYKNSLGNHRGSIRYERELDSLRTIIAYANGRLGDKMNSSLVSQQFFNKGNEHFRNQNPSSQLDGLSKNLESSVLFRNKFKKESRSLLWSGTYTYNQNDNNNTQKSLIEELAVNGESFPIENLGQLNINQLNLGNSTTSVLKTSMQYVEPIGKTITWDMFVNISHTRQSINRDIFSPPTEAGGNRVDDLSSFYDNTINYQRLGTSARYTNKGLYFMVGVAAQNIGMNGKVFNQEGGVVKSEFQSKYPALLPVVTAAYSFTNSSRLQINYKAIETTPTLTQLQPFLNNANPLFLSIGNPDLEPVKANVIDGYYTMYDPGSLMSLFVFFSYNKGRNPIVYNRTVNDELVTFSRPENINQSNENFTISPHFNFQIIKGKIGADVGVDASINKNPLYINEVLNINKSTSLGYSFGLELTPVDWFSWFIFGNFNNTKSSYSIFTQQNQTYTNNTLNSDFSFQLPKNFFIKSGLNYIHQKNEKLNLNQHLPVLGVEVYRIFGKNDRHELRLSAYDIFNKNLSVNHQATANEVSYTNTSMLSRYIMLTYSFNIKGMKKGV